ncbi:hypothetical protein GCM10023340_14210 [Nocardioides marinquilinus]|uniref:histidine kinase n=1 Tax=Nocardioides marinquilinus TaxID=1210400 RepID=A0ABP9PEB9_9ACTN
MPEATSRTPTWVLAALTALAVVTCATTDALPDAVTNVLIIVVNAGAASWAWLGSRRHGGLRRLVSTTLAIALAANALGDLVYFVDAVRRDVPDASPADVPYLLAVALLGLGLFFGSANASGRLIDLDSVVDALTVAVMSVLVVWEVQLRLGGTAGPTDLGTLVLSAYPVLDAVALGLLVRVGLSPRRRSEIGGAWLIAGLACWMGADLASLLDLVSDLDDRWTNLGWTLGGALIARANWSTVRAVAPVTGAARSATGQVLVAIIPLATPTVLLLLPTGDEPVARRVILAGTVALVALAVTRTVRVLHAMDRARADVEAARDDAVAASQAKSEFLATMSHEIRTPMNGVLGLNALLLTSDLDDRQRRWAEGVDGAGKALLSILNDVLDFAKIEAGRIEVETVELDVARVLRDVADIVVDPERAGEVRVRVDADAPPGLRGDPWRLRQVLLNLAANAVKFTPRGEVGISARTEGSDLDPPDVVRVRFEVTDTGIGIEPDDLRRIFEPFAQADASTTREFGGTGLGLSISQRLVTAMGGELRAESTPGTGSRFWFVLPLGREVATRVLLLEDGEVSQLVAEGVLRHLGYEVLTEADGARPGDADVVLADLDRVPADADGTPVVVTSADVVPPPDGVAALVRKPLRPDDVAVALDRALGAGRTAT